METKSASVARKVVTKTPVTVDKVYKSLYQKEGTNSAQLRQVVTTAAFYPSKRISNDHQDNIFSLEEFGFEEKEFTSEDHRVSWIDIPEAITNVDDVAARLPQESCLYKILSNRPIITDSQANAIDNPDLPLTLDKVANRQVVRYSDGNERAGQLILDPNGKPQYKHNFFSKTPKEDVDLRTEVANDYYVSDEIKAELLGASVIQGQQL